MFRIVSFQFGYPMYAASINSGRGPQWSDRIEEAHVYDHRDSPAAKLLYWKGEATAWGLKPSAVRVVAEVVEVAT